MSMLSTQCDNLRLMARLVRDYDYKEISRMLNSAADTIWELRNKLNDEIDNREDTEGYDQMLRDRLRQENDLRRKAEAENTKLKDLVHDCLAVIIGWSWAINEYKGVDLVDDSSPATQEMKKLLKRAKELGVDA